MTRIKNLFVFTMIMVLVLGSSFSVPTVAAQEGTNPDTMVSNLGEVPPLSAEELSAVSNKPFKGTGKQVTGAARLAGPNTFAPPVEVGGADESLNESVIGGDGRAKVTATTSYPNRTIAYLLVTWANNAQGSCTGWFIGPNTVATAGHCVYNTASGSAHGWAKSIKVYPGRNGSTLPYGYTTSKGLYSVTGWTNSTGDPRYDYGVIKTNAKLGNTVGWFGFAWQSSNSFPGTYTVRGYPGDKPTATMWTMNGAITNVNAYRQWYSIDTYGGQSGSPLYKCSTSTNCIGYGIHTYGTSVSPYYGNSATRIREAVFNNLVAWKALP